MSIEEKPCGATWKRYLRGEGPSAEALAGAPRIDEWSPTIERGHGGYKMTLHGA